MGKNSNLKTPVMCIGVVMVWRGIWDLCDQFLFPDNKFLSDIASLVAGIVILLVDDGKIDELK